MTKSKFVVVKHDAKRARLHYDLRFIMPKSKIWASFAVRKGVPTQPGVKVLAVRTHDHTEKEALMFGTIKQGYGAGRLQKWDDGDCIIHKYSPGHISIEFKGRKVKGLYHMVSTGVMNKKEFKKKSYMLFKATNQLKEDNTMDPYESDRDYDLEKLGNMCRKMFYGKDASTKLQTPFHKLCIKMMDQPGKMCRQTMYNEIMGMRSLIPRGGIVDDLELSTDELVTGPMPWGTTETVTGPASELTKVLKPSKFNIGGGLQKYMKDLQN